MTPIRQPSCRDIFEPGLIAVDDALANMLNRAVPVDASEYIPVRKARGRTLHEIIIAPFDVPGHNNAAVDGYALHSHDIPSEGIRELPIAGHVFAGSAASGRLPSGQCLRITTGAPIPAGADTVLMQEQVTASKHSIRIDSRHRAGQNIRLAGEDMRQGEAVLQPGKWLTPADIGLLASLGIAEIRVRRKLRVAVVSTGDEVCAIGTARQAGGVYDSNRYMLMAVLDRPDVEVFDLGIVADDPRRLLETFSNAADYADLIISSGGVSVGDADFTKTALSSKGRIDFWKIAVKPGRPLAFGTLQDSLFFGLPGNPVAAMVTYCLFVLPVIDKLAGITDKPAAPGFDATSIDAIRKKPGRTEIVRGILEQDGTGDWLVKTTGKQGSGILRSMSLANAFIILEHDRHHVSAGERVRVQPFAGLLC